MDIEVISWFIKQQDVRIGKQRLRQQHSELPTWRYFTHQAIVQRLVNPGPCQNPTGTTFRTVTIHFRKLDFKISHLNAIFFRHFRQSIDSIPLPLDLSQFFITHNDSINDAEFLISELVLA